MRTQSNVFIRKSGGGAQELGKEKLGQKRSFIQHDPCQEIGIVLSISVRLNALNGPAVLLVFSKVSQYNAGNSIETIYSGLLQTAVLEMLCYTENREIQFPDPPADALIKCVQAQSYEQIGSAFKISFNVTDPRTPGDTYLLPLHKVLKADELKVCPPKTSDSTIAIGVIALIGCIAMLQSSQSFSTFGKGRAPPCGRTLQT